MEILLDLRDRALEIGRRIDRAVLPPVLEPGAMPWFSLVYLVFPFLPLFMREVLVTDWWLTLLAQAVFLPLYFGFFWVRGWRRAAMVIAMAALGAALAPANMFSNTFVIYACVLSSFLPARRMLAVMVVAALLYMVPPLILNLPPSVFLLTGVFTGVLAALCQRVWIQRARANRALRLSQDEVRRLATVAERERIGRDLHDLLGHSLSVIALKSELATRIFARDPAGAEREIADVERIAREALGQVRRAVVGMRALGLRAELASARLALAAVEVDFDYRADDLKLHPEIETALALALREAATNVIRHAGARRCHAELERDGGDVRLSVRDDGGGGATASGSGLKGMRERIEALGGAVEIESASGQGTRLAIRVPFRAAPEPESDRVEPKPVARRLRAVN